MFKFARVIVGSLFIFLTLLLIKLEVKEYSSYDVCYIYFEKVYFADSSNRSFLNISKSLMFWNFITFILLVLSLKRYAWPNIINYIELRKAKILEDIEAAKVTRIESQKLYDENKILMEKVLEKREKILKEAREIGEKIKQEHLKEAIQTIEQEKKKWELELQMKSEQSLNLLKSKIVKIILVTLKHILEEKVNFSSINSEYVQNIMEKKITNSKNINFNG